MTLRFQTCTSTNTRITVGRTLFQFIAFIFETSALAGKKKAHWRHSRAWTESLKGSHTDFGHVWERNMFSNFQQTALLTREKHVNIIRMWLLILVCLKVTLWLCSLFGGFLNCFVCMPMLYSLTAMQAEGILGCSFGIQNYSLGNVLLKFWLHICPSRIFLNFLNFFWLSTKSWSWEMAHCIKTFAVKEREHEFKSL